MSGFFGKTEANVFASTFHLTDVTSNALQDAVLYAVISGKPLVSCILNYTMNQMSTQVDNFQAYAKESYSLGLPEAVYAPSLILPEQDVIDAIAADTNRSSDVIILDFHYIAPLEAIMILAPYLFTARGWDPTTNEITILPEEYQPDPEDFFYWVNPYEGFIKNVSLNEDKTLATLEYEISSYVMKYSESEDEDPYKEIRSTETFTETQELPAGLKYGRDYCVALYYVLDSEGSPSEDFYWWYYDISSQLYPALTPDGSIDSQDNLLPVIPIRYRNQSLVREEVQDTELYKTSKILLSKIGVNIDQVAEEVEANPDIADIDHAYITFGADLQSDEPATLRYLVEYFDFLFDKSQINVFDSISEHIQRSPDSVWEPTTFSYNSYGFTAGKGYGFFNNLSDLPVGASTEVTWDTSEGNTSTFSVTANDAIGTFEEYGLNKEISYSYIRSEIIEGSIGDIGHVEKSMEMNSFVLPEEHNGFFGTYTTRRTIDDPTLILKLQIADNAYKKITVKGLVHRNHIHEERSHITILTDVMDNEDEHNFIIPLHYNLTQKLSPIDRNQLYQDSLVLILNSVEITTEAWYESMAFKFIVTAVGLVLTATSGIGSSFLQGLSGALAAGAGAFTVYLLENILITYALSIGLDYVAQWVGPEIMAGLAVAVIALSGYAKFAGLDGVTFLGVTAPSASQLMGVASSMLSSAKSAYSTLIGDITEEMQEFEAEKAGKLAKLEEYTKLIEEVNPDAENLLEAQTYSTTLRQPALNSPEEFYDLAIHTGNPGTLSLSVPMTFCDIALNLPKPDNSILV